MSVRLYAELAVAIALAAVLDLISKSLPLPRLPYGGSISLRALPILIIAFRHGTRAGVMAGGGYGVVDFLIHPVFVHPIQLLLDYPIALGTLGCAGWVRGQRAVLSRGQIVLGILLGCGLRLTAHFISGIVFFAQFAPAGQPGWQYSLSYNSAYMVPETIILIVLAPLIMRRMQGQ